MKIRTVFSFFLSCLAAAFLLGIGQAWAEGIMKLRDGYYHDEIEDFASMDLVQALVVNSADTSAGVSSTWTWAQPSPPAGEVYSNGTLFSSGGTNTLTEISYAGSAAERVKLFQQWYSAAKDMDWRDDCRNGVPGAAGCYVYPVTAFPTETAKGSRSREVLHVPSIKNLSTCQAAVCGNRDILSFTRKQSYVNDILVAGRRVNAAWFVRSTSLPLSEQKIALFTIGYTYSVSGGGSMPTAYKGGAVVHNSCPAESNCSSNPESGNNCAVGLFSDTATYSPKLYNGDVYSPYSFSFCVGDWYGVDGNGDPLCKGCGSAPAGDPTQDICGDPPGGFWVFRLHTAGYGTGACGATNPVACKNADASASIFVDGLMLTSGTGDYTSPQFDSLSSNTVWTRIGWDFDFNPDGGSNPRTPVYLKWRTSATYYTDVSTLSETGNEAISATSRYFDYRAYLYSWDENPNLALRPPSKGGFDACVRYSPMYDGSLSPLVKRITAEYQPDAGRFVSKAIAPYRLRRWKQASFQFSEDSGNGGDIVVDILDGGMNPVMTNVSSPVSLAHLDPNRYSSLRLRATLYKNGNAAANSKLYWFRFEFETMRDCLELDHNSIRLSQGEEAGILYCVDEGGMVDVKVYDNAGQLVKRVFHGELAAAPAYRQVWDGTDSKGRQVTAGLYFVTVSTPAGHYTKKIAVSR